MLPNDGDSASSRRGSVHLHNGVQASWLEVDTDTGFVKLLKHWVVEDCGTIINPQLVDEQIRGMVCRARRGFVRETHL